MKRIAVDIRKYLAECCIAVVEIPDDMTTEQAVEHLREFDRFDVVELVDEPEGDYAADEPNYRLSPDGEEMDKINEPEWEIQ